MPTTTPQHDERMENLVFADIYPMYVDKVIKKELTGQTMKQMMSKTKYIKQLLIQWRN
jgi:hypothetical protein